MTRRAGLSRRTLCQPSVPGDPYVGADIYACNCLFTLVGGDRSSAIRARHPIVEEPHTVNRPSSKSST
jgi:hypothetical protein